MFFSRISLTFDPYTTSLSEAEGEMLKDVLAICGVDTALHDGAPLVCDRLDVVRDDTAAIWELGGAIHGCVS